MLADTLFITDAKYRESQLKKLRKKIAAVAADVDLIHSIYGVGYKYETI